MNCRSVAPSSLIHRSGGRAAAPTAVFGGEDGGSVCLCESTCFHIFRLAIAKMCSCRVRVNECVGKPDRCRVSRKCVCGNSCSINVCCDLFRFRWNSISISRSFHNRFSQHHTIEMLIIRKRFLIFFKLIKRITLH